MSICAHEGWGSYCGEDGPCPDPVAMNSIEGGEECPSCGYRVQTFTGADAINRSLALNRETATLDRETR